MHDAAEMGSKPAWAQTRDPTGRCFRWAIAGDGHPGHRAHHLPQETPTKTLGPTPDGSGPSADGDFMAKGKKLVVEEGNWLCLLRGSNRRSKLNLPGLIFRDAPGTSQQKANKREAVPCIFRKKHVCMILFPSYSTLKT